jgi:hypothetical protein
VNVFSKRGFEAATIVVMSFCTSCTASTGSERFSFEASVGGPAAANGEAFTFPTQTGWQVTLSQADVTLGPVYLNVISPLRRTGMRLGEWLVPNAWAQGEGHLDEGRVVGEVLSQVTFSAISSELVHFPASGTLTAEQIRTAEVWFFPEPGVAPETTDIDTVALEVRGVARREDREVRFRGSLILNDDWLAEQAAGSRALQPITAIRKVRGIPAGIQPSEGGRLEIRLDITRLFRGAEFANLDDNPADADGTRVLVQAKSGRVTRDQVMTNLYQGLRELNTYSVTWAEP